MWLIDKAAEGAVGSGGQIGGDRPGMLVVGRIQLRDDEVKHLEAAARTYMERRGQRYTFLSSIGVTFLDFASTSGLYGAVRVMPVFNYVPNPRAEIRFP